MGAEVRYRLRVQVTFECDVDWDAVTGAEATREFDECWKEGTFGLGNLELDDTPAAKVIATKLVDA